MKKDAVARQNYETFKQSQKPVKIQDLIFPSRIAKLLKCSQQLRWIFIVGPPPPTIEEGCVSCLEQLAMTNTSLTPPSPPSCLPKEISVLDFYFNNK